MKTVAYLSGAYSRSQGRIQGSVCRGGPNQVVVGKGEFLFYGQMQGHYQALQTYNSQVARALKEHSAPATVTGRVQNIVSAIHTFGNKTLRYRLHRLLSS